MKTFAEWERRSKHRTKPAQHAEAAGGLADLQRAVGNRALARALSTPAGTRVLQRWWGVRPPAPAGERVRYTVTCTLEGGSAFPKKKSFNVLSYHWGTEAGDAFKQKPKEKEAVKERKPMPRDVFVMKEQDGLTATLMNAVATGQHVDKVQLLTTGGSKSLIITLSDVLLTSFQPTGSYRSDKLFEEIGFTFEDATFESK